MEIIDKTHPDFLPFGIDVLTNMRQMDRKELAAVRGEALQPGPIIAQLWKASADLWIHTTAGKGCVLIGGMPLWPGVWSVFSMSRTLPKRAWAEVTTWARSFMIPHLEAKGAHRLQCYVLDDRKDVQRWLTREFGFEREGTHRAFGRSGETFATFARVRHPQPRTQDLADGSQAERR